jgi:hypothetical protein
VTTYLFFYALAIVAAAAVMIVEGRRRRFDGVAWVIAVVAWAIGGMIGAEVPRQLLGDVVAARTAVGAVAGATLALVMASALLRIRQNQALDTTAIAIPIGGAIARLGCFAADCCQGIATNLPIGVTDHDGVRRHPAQLYEAAFDTAIVAWLIRMKPGAVMEGHRFLLSLGAMSTGRFMIEFLRDSEKIGPLSLAQWIVGPAAIACFAIVSMRIRIPRVSRATPIAALALQMPPISGDTLYPRNYVSGGASLFGGSFDWVHDVGSCEVEENYTRGHKIGGVAAEVGYRHQVSATRGFGFRFRPFSATENATESRDYRINGSPSPSGFTFPAYTVKHRGATIAGDFDFKYLGLTFGGTFGQFYPLIDAEDDDNDHRTVQGSWPAMGLRLGTQRVAVEIRAGDEYPVSAPFPAFTFGFGFGNGKDTRVRVGASDMGPFIALRHVLPRGLEIAPMFGGAHEGWMGGLMVKQWVRTDPKTR